jgi:hypothetical protein
MKKRGLGGTLPIEPTPPEARPTEARPPEAASQSHLVDEGTTEALTGGSVGAGAEAWNELYGEFMEAESRRRERAKRRAEEEDALREFEQWSSRTTERLMNDVKRIAEGRSREFLARTGHTLVVQYPSGPSISGPSGDPEIRFLRLSLGAARVHVYSSHARGGTTHIHLLPSRGDSLQRNHRLVSEPGAFLVRTSDENYELRFLRGDPADKSGSPMPLDLLMFKAFRLLIRIAEDDAFEDPFTGKRPQSG